MYVNGLCSVIWYVCKYGTYVRISILTHSMAVLDDEEEEGMPGLNYSRDCLAPAHSGWFQAVFYFILFYFIPSLPP